MKLVEINWAPTPRQLRQFGSLCLVALPLIGWLWSASNGTLMWLAGIGLGLAITGWVVPMALKPVFVGLMIVALPIGMVVSEVVMALIYYLVFFPIGLIFKLMRRDALGRGLQRDSETYWAEKKPAKDVASYYRQS